MYSIFSKIHQCLLFILLGINIIGCTPTVNIDMALPNASPTTVEYLRTVNLLPLNVGKFRVAPGLDPSMDKSLPGLRNVSYQSTFNGYSQQLKEVIVTELKAAGLYDNKSKFRIEGQLRESEVDAAMKTGTAKLGARFIVYSLDTPVFDKTLSVSSTWESSLIGERAIPTAIIQYSSLYNRLAAKLFKDREFLSVMKH